LHNQKENHRLIIASNRLPFSVKERDGRLQFSESTGGLVTGLASYLAAVGKDPDAPAEYVWVGWPGSTVPETLRSMLRERASREYHSVPVYLSSEEMDAFYLGFCNKTIWPLFHYFPSLAVYKEEFWETYVDVNRRFCDAVAEIAREGDLIWVHDYHLMLLPGMLKERLPSAQVGFFLHIPFPSYEVFRLLPGQWRKEILSGILGADLVGFHTFDYTQHFLQSVLRILGHENYLGSLALPQRIVKVETFPMGIDFDHFVRATEHQDTLKEQEEIRHALDGKRVVLSVDRLDYTKGILNRLQGFESLLTMHPHYRGKVVLLMVVVPSRAMVDRYEDMKRQIEESVGKINGLFGTVGWTPVIYQYRYLSLHPLTALYALSDVALVTPLRDGMNLVAKEYLATRTGEDGALILSEMAGAAKELGEAITINPNNRLEIASALREALEMPQEEQRRRMQIMRGRLKRYTVRRWARDFTEQLARTRIAQESYLAKLLSSSSRTQLLDQYVHAGQRLLFLDYDGTLMPFSRQPSLASPSKELLNLLMGLARQRGNTVVVISGRDRGTLGEWLGYLPVHLVAEHGMWQKEAGKEWRMLKTQPTEWKERLRPILELYADRLPGAIVEEKDFSLVWHYRAADPEQSQLLVRELRDHLVTFTANIDLQVLQGSKVVEVRNSGINKGVAAQEWLGRQGYDFILAAGDDWTDEDLFAVLPGSAWSLKVGMASTRARFNLRESRDMYRLLDSLLRREHQDGGEGATKPNLVQSG
jgi:trehalose 6-phosphate synthase/phosphatase